MTHAHGWDLRRQDVPGSLRERIEGGLHTEGLTLPSSPFQVMGLTGRLRDCERITEVALERYAAALVDRKLPVPPALRDELRLAKGVVW